MTAAVDSSPAPNGAVATTALVPREQARSAWTVLRSFAEAVQLADTVAKSNLFPDACTGPKALVKILAGAEMGFGPFAALADVHIIDGKPSIGAHLRAAAIQGSGRYHYRILRLDDQACELEFFQGSETLGKSTFTFEEARKAGLIYAREGKGIKVGDRWIRTNWHTAPRNMLFARAISNGYKWFCPDLSGGVLTYDPDELDRPDEPIPAAVLSAAPVQDAEVVASTPPSGTSLAVPAADLSRLVERRDAALQALGLSVEAFSKTILKLYGTPRWEQMSDSQRLDCVTRMEKKLPTKQEPR